MTAPLMPPAPPSSPAAPHLRTRRIVTVPPRTARPTGEAGDHGPRALQLLDRDDLDWIAELTDAVAALAGQPWRIALDAIEAGTWRRGSAPHAPGASPQAPDVSPRRLNAATTALRRLLAGNPREAELARQARALLLGVPALDEASRTARVTTTATLLGIAPVTVERVLWADVPRERPIELTRGRPTAREVAALANVGLLQRALARAHSAELVVRGDASPILRGAAARGLIVTASHREVADAAGATGQPTDQRETVLDITGPLALCHGTTVYGRALGSLVPLLAGCASFALTIRAESRGNLYELRVASPALLPASPVRPWPLVERLANDLERAGAPLGIAVRRAPPALAQPPRSGHRGVLACPDLGIEIGERVVWIEVIGFWTPEYLARKHARYRAVGAGEVVLCVDSTRACDDDDPPPGACVVRFERRVHAEVLLQLLGVA